MSNIKHLNSKGHESDILFIAEQSIPDGYTIDDLAQLKEQGKPIPYVSLKSERTPQFLRKQQTP